MNPSVFVENMSHAAAGVVSVDDKALALCTMLGQGDASAFFLSVGSEVERATSDKHASERAMHVLAQTARMLPMAARGHPQATEEQMADLLSFFAGRVRNNAARLFPTPDIGATS